MHQSIDHLWREGMHLYLCDMWIGQIVALFAPGCYFVRDQFGRGCFTQELWLEKAGVKVLSC